MRGSGDTSWDWQEKPQVKYIVMENGGESYLGNDTSLLGNAERTDEVRALYLWSH